MHPTTAARRGLAAVNRGPDGTDGRGAADLRQPLRGLDPEAAVGVEEAAAIEDTQSTDILRPNLIRPRSAWILRSSAAPLTAH